MAYRMETGINGQPEIVIDGFDKGIAPDPYSGINDLRNVNIGTVPGEVSAGFPLTESTVSGVALGIPVSRATAYSSGTAIGYYILDADGHVFESTSISGTWTYLSTGVTLTNASANDVVFCWKGYIFKTRNTAIDYYSGGTWTNAWAGLTLTGSTTHYTIIGNDDVVYICNGNKIASIMEKAGATFDPTNSATYTTTTTALALPTYEIAQSLAELNTTLLVGGTQNVIYPWDRISTSYRYPIFCAENYIRKMLTVNNNVLVFPGNTTGRGTIYITNGSQIDVFAKMPDYITGYNEPYYKFYDAIYHRNNCIFGVEIVQNTNGNVIISPTANVWAIDMTTRALRAISTCLGGSGSPRVLIPDQKGNSVPGFSYMLGQSNGSTHTIGYSGTGAGIGSYTVITDMIPVGTFLNKKTFSQVEFKLRTPLESGESIQITPITDGVSGTAFTTTSFANSGAIISTQPYEVNFEKSQWLSFLIVATGNSSTSGVRLKEIRIR